MWQQAVLDAVESHGAKNLRVATRILGCLQNAEDVCQAAYVKALGARDQIRDSDALPAWIKQVVVNEALVVLRRQKTHRKVEAEIRQNLPVDEDGLSRMVDGEWVQHAVQQLDERTRQVVILRMLDGKRGNEVAEILDLSSSEVSRRLHRGMEQLRQAWQGLTHGRDLQMKKNGVIRG